MTTRNYFEKSYYWIYTPSLQPVAEVICTQEGDRIVCIVYALPSTACFRDGMPIGNPVRREAQIFEYTYQPLTSPEIVTLHQDTQPHFLLHYHMQHLITREAERRGYDVHAWHCDTTYTHEPQRRLSFSAVHEWRGDLSRYMFDRSYLYPRVAVILMNTHHVKLQRLHPACYEDDTAPKRIYTVNLYHRQLGTFDRLMLCDGSGNLIRELDHPLQAFDHMRSCDEAQCKALGYPLPDTTPI